MWNSFIPRWISLKERKWKQEFEISNFEPSLDMVKRMQVYIYGSNRSQQNKIGSVYKVPSYFTELTIASWQKVASQHLFCSAVEKFELCRVSNGVHAEVLFLNFTNKCNVA